MPGRLTSLASFKTHLSPDLQMLSESPEATSLDSSGQRARIRPFIGGNELPPDPLLVPTEIKALHGHSLLQIQSATHWQVEAAVESANRQASALGRIPIEVKIECIRETAARYLLSASDLKLISDISGTPISVVESERELFRSWGDSIASFAELALPHDDNSCEWRPSAPLFLLLPSNSCTEIPFTLFQAVLSGVPVLARPSRRGSSAFCLHKFIEAWAEAARTVASGPAEEALRSAISSIPISDGIRWDQLAIDDWNYLLFGTNETLIAMEESIRSHAKPRKVIGLGTGLSTSIVMPDANLSQSATFILDSASANAGTNCLATDIVYVHESVAADIENEIKSQLANYGCCDSDNRGAIGHLAEANLEAILTEVSRRGKTRHLRLEGKDGHSFLSLSAIPLNEYESAIEFPGPVFSTRTFHDPQHLAHLVRKDLSDNDQERNLTTSVFCDSESSWEEARHASCAWICKRNRPTHEFDPTQPHQGMYLARELSACHRFS